MQIKNNTFATIFFSLLLATTFVTNWLFFTTRTSWVLVFSLGLIFGILNFKYKEIQVRYIDIGIATFLIYTFSNFSLIGSSTFMYNQLWALTGYALCYYLFQHLFKNSNHTKPLIATCLIIVLCVCVVESAIGYLQYFKILSPRNGSKIATGTFSTSNFLGAYMGFGLTICTWYFLYNKPKNKKILTLMIIISVLLGGALIISQSRGSWLATLGACSILYLSSVKIKSSFRQLTGIKRWVIAVAIFLVSLLGVKALYNLNPDSVNGRLFITKITAKEVAKKPVFGHGLFSFAKGYNKAKADYFSAEKRSWKEVKTANYVYNTFNDYLNVIYELGIVGFLLALIPVILLFTKIDRTKETVIGLALFVNVLILSFFTSPIYNTSLMTVGIFGASVLGYYKKEGTKKIVISSKPFLVIMALCGVLGLYLLNKQIRAKKNLDVYRMEDYRRLKNVDEFVQLFKNVENNKNTTFSLAKTLLGVGYKKEGLMYLEQAFNQTQAPKIALELVDRLIEKGNFKRAEELLKFNVNVEPYRFEPRIKLAQFYTRYNRHEDATKLWKNMAELPIKIPSPKTESIKATANYAKNLKNPLQLNIKGSLSKDIKVSVSQKDKHMNCNVYLPSTKHITKKLPVVYFIEGQHYLQDNFNLIRMVDELIEATKLEPIAMVFIELRYNQPLESEEIKDYFKCDAVYVDFFSDKLFPLIESSFPIKTNRKYRTMIGNDLGGFFVAHYGISASHEIKNIAIQSPSFSHCEDLYNNFGSQMNRDLNVYLSYNNEEESRIQVEPLIDNLKFRNYQTQIEVIKNQSSLSEQTEKILMYFYKK